MKKEYIEPTMITVRLSSRSKIMAGSNLLDSGSGNFSAEDYEEDTKGSVTAW